MSHPHPLPCDQAFLIMAHPAPFDRPGHRKNVVLIHVCALCMLFLGGFCGCHKLSRRSGPGSDICQQHIEQSFMAQQAGDLEKAKKHLQEATSMQPRRAEAWWNLSELSIQRDEYSNAIEELRQYIELQPNDPQGYLRLAQLYYLQDEYKLSEDVLKESLKRSPNNFEVVILSARLARKQSDYQRSVADYYRALQLSPHHVSATLELSELLIARRESTRASSMLRELSRKTLSDEDLARTHLNLGIAYGQENRWENAVKHLETSRGLTPEMSSRDLYRLAYANWKSGASQQALMLLIEMSDQGRWTQRAESLYMVITESDSQMANLASHSRTETPLDLPGTYSRSITQTLMQDRIVKPDRDYSEELTPPEWIKP